MITVTKPYLPPFHEYEALLRSVWDNGWITNNGPVVQDLESALAKCLEVPKLTLVNSGTTGIQLALKALRLNGEIITTPFSFVATASCIVWEHCTPVFVDIDPESLNIDPGLIEQAITSDTCAILATHVFGNPAEVELLEDIAQRHDLKLIYDAAHCFGVKFNDTSLFSFGDISILSMHATKIFHTIEGGAVICRDAEVQRRIDLMRSFGQTGSTTISEVGINGKMSEFHACMGLCNLGHVDEVMARRKAQYEVYVHCFANSAHVQLQAIHPKATYNFAYFPIILESSSAVEKIISRLHETNVFPRRYFYPSLNRLAYVECTPTPVSERISETILCLPLSHELRDDEISRIASTVLDCFR